MNEQLIKQPQSQDKQELTTAMKAALALLNGKRESLSREYYKRLFVDLDTVVEIDVLINEKLSTEKLSLSMTSIDFSLENGKKLAFNSITSMCEHRWGSESKCINTILIMWDFFLVLPNFAEPQRHTLSLRLMDMKIPEFLYDMGMVEDSTSSFFIAPTAVGRIDFINNIIAEELTQIIDNWIENRECKNDPKIQIFSRKHIKGICGIAYWVGFSILPLGACIITKKLLITQSINDQILPIIAILLFIPYFARQIGTFIRRILNKRIVSYWGGHIFAITNGDSKECEKTIEKRKSKKEWIVVFINTIISIGLTVLAIIL